MQYQMNENLVELWKIFQEVKQNIDFNFSFYQHIATAFRVYSKIPSRH